MVTLEEVVVINYKELTQQLLTCAACLSTYDRSQHVPKLLTCAHSVCILCLQQFCTKASEEESEFFSCPMCRVEVHVPEDGASAFPSDFRSNQLLDLLNGPDRGVIPKCSDHSSQELLFCEPCGRLFCDLCNSQSHENTDPSNREHAIVPSSFAVKRESKILSTKAHQCKVKLDEGCQNISSEINELDSKVNSLRDEIDLEFNCIKDALDKRQKDLVAVVEGVHKDKREVLQNQLEEIEREKIKIEDYGKFKFGGDFSEMTKKIEDLEEMESSICTMIDPKTKCSISYLNAGVIQVHDAIMNYGAIESE